MKRFIMIYALLVITVAIAFAQKVDYSQYNVIAQKGNVTVVEKDGKDYRMIVGSLKKPKKEYLMGHNKDFAIGHFSRLLQFMEHEKNSESGRIEMFCGSQIRVFAKGDGEQREFTFKEDNSKAKFSLTRQDCLELEDKIRQH